ncbi:MAG: hypothetical protein M5R37_02160 [Melioribacteraceae bacterium]|nr:hypothetical protein [Melioribacteraceae bacterium]
MKNIRERDEDYYNKSREESNRNLIRSAKSIDYILFSITTGIIILSIQFLGSINVLSFLQLLPLFISLIFSMLTIVFYSLAFFSSVKYNKKVIDKLDSWESNDFDENFSLPEKSNWFDYFYNFQTISFVTLGISIVSLFLFLIGLFM